MLLFRPIMGNPVLHDDMGSQWTWDLNGLRRPHSLPNRRRRKNAWKLIWANKGIGALDLSSTVRFLEVGHSVARFGDLRDGSEIYYTSIRITAAQHLRRLGNSMKGFLMQDVQHSFAVHAIFASEETTNRSCGYVGVSAESVQVCKGEVEED